MSEQIVLKVAKITIVLTFGGKYCPGPKQYAAVETARCYSGGLADGATITDKESHDHILIESNDHADWIPEKWNLIIGNKEWNSDELPYLEAILAEWMKDEGFDLPADMTTSHPDWEGF